jgi:glutaminyl-peptide cyclotransferase
MTLYKSLTLSILALLTLSCGGKKNLDNNYSIATTAAKNSMVNGGAIAISIKAKKNYVIDSIVYSLDGNQIASTTQATNFKTNLKSPTLGTKTLAATIYTQEGKTVAKQQITLLHTKGPKIYGYKIVNRFPHKTDAYTQGLEFVGDTLYESNGQYGESTLRKLDYTTGNILQEITLGDQYFAEGLTILDNKMYQLTWRENTGFIYDLATFSKTGTFAYGTSKEGWGLCNDGSTIYKSDGTSKIWKLDPMNLTEQSFIEPTDNKRVYKKFNELEFVNGKIYANTYQLPSIAIIDPITGALEGIIDLKSLPEEVQSGLDKQNQVLNGIAFKANENRLFVTGKHWNTLFEIEIVEK